MGDVVDFRSKAPASQGEIGTEEVLPCTFRIAHYPDGSRRVQGGYKHWSNQGAGIRWRDLPVVDVDDQGNEVPT